MINTPDRPDFDPRVQIAQDRGKVKLTDGRDAVLFYWPTDDESPAVVVIDGRHYRVPPSDIIFLGWSEMSAGEHHGR